MFVPTTIFSWNNFNKIVNNYWNRVALDGNPWTWSNSRNRMKTFKFKIICVDVSWYYDVVLLCMSWSVFFFLPFVKVRYYRVLIGMVRIVCFTWYSPVGSHLFFLSKFILQSVVIQCVHEVHSGFWKIVARKQIELATCGLRQITAKLCTFFFDADRWTVTQTQRNDRTQFNKQPPSDYAIRDWQRRFLETGSVHDRKRSGRPGVSVECVETVHASFVPNPTKSTRRKPHVASSICLRATIFKTPSGLCGHTIYIYIYIYVCVCVCSYIYIYI
jgi:hypothetical protein